MFTFPSFRKPTRSPASPAAAGRTEYATPQARPVLPWFVHGTQCPPRRAALPAVAAVQGCAARGLAVFPGSSAPGEADAPVRVRPAGLRAPVVLDAAWHAGPAESAGPTPTARRRCCIPP